VFIRKKTYMNKDITIQGGPKNKPLPNKQKIVLKPVNEIRFIRQIKV